MLNYGTLWKICCFSKHSPSNIYAVLLFQPVFTSKHPQIKSVSATKLKAELPDLRLFGSDTTGRIFEIHKSPNAQHHSGMRKHFCQMTFNSFITMSQEKSCYLTSFQKVYCSRNQVQQKLHPSSHFILFL